jgi:hypothetical protein
VAQVLDEEIVPALSGPVQHHARVAANLVAIVERELRLAPDAAERERKITARLLGEDVGAASDLVEARAELARRLRAGLADTDDGTVWSALMDCVRDDLAISKPGHDAWDGD